MSKRKREEDTPAGGVYIPPARLRAMQAEITDKSSPEYQRMAWEALKKSINGLINKVNISNIKNIIPELLEENLVRGKGLFVRSVMKAQSASLTFTPVYAALVTVINTKLPQIGELLLMRLIVQLRKAYKRDDKTACVASVTFIAHLFNFRVAHEILPLQIIALLLRKPTDDSVEIAVGFLRECGQLLAEVNPPLSNGVFDQFRTVLHEGHNDKRIQYMIEVLFQVRKDKFKNHPTIPDGLDLVEEDELITHMIQLDEEVDAQDVLNVFKFDPEYEENEAKYKAFRDELLGESDDEDGSEKDDEDEDDEEDAQAATSQQKMDIRDETNANLVNLRRTIYLTIMSSLDFEECCHKLMKINIQPGQEIELCNMIIECCSQERTYTKFYGLMGERFSKLNRMWATSFEECFVNYYDTIHRYETNRLRNIAHYFGHLLTTDALGWHVLSCIKLTEDDTTSSSRIFIKILFGDLVEALGLKKLKEKMEDPQLRDLFLGMFPRENAKNIRFAINYFTSIGLGGLTEGLREELKNAPKKMLEQEKEQEFDSASERSFSSSYESGSRSRSRSYSYSRSPSPRRNGTRRSTSYSRSPSPRPNGSRRSISYSRSPSPDRSRDRPRRSPSYSRSPSPVRRRRRSPSYSRSPTPDLRRPRRPRRSSPSYNRSPTPDKRRD